MRLRALHQHDSHLASLHPYKFYPARRIDIFVNLEDRTQHIAHSGTLVRGLGFYIMLAILSHNIMRKTESGHKGYSNNNMLAIVVRMPKNY